MAREQPCPLLPARCAYRPRSGERRCCSTATSEWRHRGYRDIELYRMDNVMVTLHFPVPLGGNPPGSFNGTDRLPVCDVSSLCMPRSIASGKVYVPIVLSRFKRLSPSVFDSGKYLKRPVFSNGLFDAHFVDCFELPCFG